ncbi:hypothetical protein [Amaricoccus tamworthensis]|uniref:hypothetical protein n=1 Tax=Amaricoccus tamworthensis TaxID=57002 RepID=UPI003C7DBFA7
MSVDDRALMAAGNNADWYAVMFRAHGLEHERMSFAFVGRDRPPPYYSNLTVLRPGHANGIVRLVAELAQAHGGKVGLKDSFCELDLEGNGFQTRFEASWIWREASARQMPDGWRVVKDAEDLSAWENAWKSAGSPADRRMFPASLLDHPDVRFCVREDAGKIVSGCIANRSGDCIGLSNVFSTSEQDGYFSEAADAAFAFDESLPVVGYESGSDLDLAKAAGFETVGDLRVLYSEAVLL